MSKSLKSYLQGLAVGTIAVVSLLLSQHSAYGAVLNGYANDFSQFCSDNPDTCVKVDFSNVRTGSITCPSGLSPINIYVHAGDGQTVYRLPETGFSYIIDGSTVTVTLTTHKHDISWIGATCGSSLVTPPEPPVTPPQPSDDPGDPTPTPTPNTTKSSDTGSDNSSDNSSSSNESQGEVLGAYAGTGVAEDVIMNALGSLGGLMTVGGSVLYGKKKRS